MPRAYEDLGLLLSFLFHKFVLVGPDCTSLRPLCWKLDSCTRNFRFEFVLHWSVLVSARFPRKPMSETINSPKRRMVSKVPKTAGLSDHVKKQIVNKTFACGHLTQGNRTTQNTTGASGNKTRSAEPRDNPHDQPRDNMCGTHAHGPTEANTGAEPEHNIPDLD